MKELLPTAFLLTFATTLLAACAADEGERKLALAEIDARHTSEKAQLQDAQDAFARRWKAPIELDFPGEGTIQVHECSVQGYEGHVELHLNYTYVNTTGHPIDGVRVEVELVDPRTKAVRVEEMRLSFPPMIPFVPDSSFTTTANIPTRGLHLLPGWEWRIRPKLVVRGVKY